MSSQERESVTVLQECVDLQRRKSQDYQNPNSNIKQAMHYRRGVSTIHDMVQQKMYRAQSLLEPLENGQVGEPNFESLEDTYKDAINYLSFAVSYIRGKMEGQDPNRDMLNRARTTTYVMKPEGGGTGTGVEVTREEFEDYTGGSSSGQVEMDGFQTLYPKYPSRETEVMVEVASTYVNKVAPIGRIPAPEEKPDETIRDSVARTYQKVTDVGDRMEEEYADIKRVSEK